jgi:transcriptional regulator with XRE-family HTH domain
MDNLVDWLAEELRKHNMSMRELARRAGVSHTTVADVMAGQRKPTWEFCAAIARPLNADPREVFRLAGLLSSKPDGGNPDVAPDELALANVLRKERGKRELTADDFERDFFDSDDPMLQDFKRIWGILSYNERQKLIHMAEDLERERKGESAEERAAGKVTIGRTAEGVA